MTFPQSICITKRFIPLSALIPAPVNTTIFFHRQFFFFFVVNLSKKMSFNKFELLNYLENFLTDNRKEGFLRVLKTGPNILP